MLDTTIAYERKQTLKITSGKLKENKNSYEKSEIKQTLLNCSDCAEKLYGQFQRVIKTRYGEHLA